MRSAQVLFVALLLMIGCTSARSQAPATAATAPVEASTSTSVVLTAQGSSALAEGLTAAVPATRTPLPPTTAPDPLDGLYGRYSCRFATAGRVTPCCPDATEVLDQFWTGDELAIADYIVGREGGCNAAIVNSSGCIGWWQMCGKSCPPDGCKDPWSSTAKAKQLYDQRHWCDWYLRGDPVTGHAC